MFLVGFFCWLAGSKFLNRDSPRAAHETLAKFAKELVRDNSQLCICVEGTRNPARGLRPFKRGAFICAIIGQIPTIRMVVSPHNFIDHEKRQFGKGTVILKTLDPIPTKSMVYEDHEKLVYKTRQAMLREYEKLTKEVGGRKDK